MPDTSSLRAFDEIDMSSSSVTFTAARFDGQGIRDRSAEDRPARFFRGFVIGLAIVVPVWGLVAWAIFFR